eukprot:gene3822-1388_t
MHRVALMGEQRAADAAAAAARETALQAALRTKGEELHHIAGDLDFARKEVERERARSAQLRRRLQDAQRLLRASRRQPPRTVTGASGGSPPASPPSARTTAARKCGTNDALLSPDPDDTAAGNGVGEAAGSNDGALRGGGREWAAGVRAMEEEAAAAIAAAAGAQRALGPSPSPSPVRRAQ